MSAVRRTVFVLLAVLSPTLGHAQGGGGSAPGTAWVTPIWEATGSSPRPLRLSDRKPLLTRRSLTEEEAAAFLQEGIEASKQFFESVMGEPEFFGLPIEDVFPTTPPVDGRTSAIVDPPNGRIPPRTEAGAARSLAALTAFLRLGADHPEDRPLLERCLLGWVTPLAGWGPNSQADFWLFQTPDLVAIYTELPIGEFRLVPLDHARPLPPGLVQRRGSSRGRWDGDTLVVETTNLHPNSSFQGSGPELRLTERFTRVDAETLRYGFTVDDPASFAAPWSVDLPLKRQDGDRYIADSMCHEGNYSIPLMLSGSRAEEEAAKFHGTFTLASYERYEHDGTVRTMPYREGMLAYDGGGRMSVQLLNPDRPVPIGDISDEDRLAVYQSYVAYYGNYDVNAARKVVHHQIEGALSPNLVDRTLTRGYRFADDDQTLILIVKDGDRVVGEQTWERSP